MFLLKWQLYVIILLFFDRKVDDYEWHCETPRTDGVWFQNLFGLIKIVNYEWQCNAFYQLNRIIDNKYLNDSTDLLCKRTNICLENITHEDDDINNRYQGRKVWRCQRLIRTMANEKDDKYEQWSTKHYRNMQHKYISKTKTAVYIVESVFKNNYGKLTNQTTMLARRYSGSIYSMRYFQTNFKGMHTERIKE